MRKAASLDDAEQGLVLARVGLDAALKPGMGATTGIDDIIFCRRIGRALVERHGHIGTQGHLNLRRMLRCHVDDSSIARVAEHHAAVIDLVEVPQAEHLKPPGVGQHRAVPAHEPVQASGGLNDGLAGLKVQVIRIRQHHLGARPSQLLRADSLDGGQGPHRHEAGGLNRPMRRLKTAAAGCCALAARLDLEAEHDAEVFC